MDRKNALDRFEFHHDLILDQKVDTIAIVDRQIPVSNRNRDLPTNAQAELFQLVQKASFVSTLKETRSDDRVNLYRCPDDCGADIVLGHPPRPQRNLSVLSVKAYACSSRIRPAQRSRIGSVTSAFSAASCTTPRATPWSR